METPETLKVGDVVVSTIGFFSGFGEVKAIVNLPAGRMMPAQTMIRVLHMARWGGDTVSLCSAENLRRVDYQVDEEVLYG